jgi:tRNA(Arg) A34 adenosine deaminase TadA/ADP-ribose pyrophosphatase YjhB (NUDIX family)
MALPYKISTLLYCFNPQDDILLLERAREPNRGQWSPAGGKLKTGTGESPYACACREAREELALELTPPDLHLTGLVSEHGYLGQAHWLMFLFEVRPRLTVLPAPIREGRFAFFTRAELAALALPQTDRERLWPLFWQHRGGFFAAHCHVHADGRHDWALEASLTHPPCGAGAPPAQPPGGASVPDADPPCGAGTPPARLRCGAGVPPAQPPPSPTLPDPHPTPLPVIDLHSDDHFMTEALRQARRAYAAAEVPVGAVVVRDGRVIGRAFNQVELLKDATAHAEMLALTQAQAAVGDWRLNDCTLYVTKEPCPMCAGAIVHARVGRVVFGAGDPRAGAAGGVLNLLQFPTLNHRCQITAGVRQADCAGLLRQFFAEQRTRPRRADASLP